MTVKEMKCIHVAPAVNPPPAVDGCCDRQQRLTGRGKAARRPPHRLLYRPLHQIGAVSQLSTHSTTQSIRQTTTTAGGNTSSNTPPKPVRKKRDAGMWNFFEEMKSAPVIRIFFKDKLLCPSESFSSPPAGNSKRTAAAGLRPKFTFRRLSTAAT